MDLAVGRRPTLIQLNSTVFGVADDQHIEEAEISNVSQDSSQEGTQLIWE